MDQPNALMGSRSSDIRRSLFKPYRIASILAATALLIALGFLAYMAWSSTQRLDPLGRHLTHLQELQDSSLDVQELIIRHIEQATPPHEVDVARISARLQKILESGDHLHPDTPDKLWEARSFLDETSGDPKVGLLAALTLIRQILLEENQLQRVAVGAAHDFARTELILASVALLLAPASLMLLLVYIRRRSFRSLRTLGSMLENVGDLEFRPLQSPDRNDPLHDVFARYNAMTEKLRLASDEADRQQKDLESQVRMASETLLRQQNELADGARLAAIGEFSARVAHELRNPVSGIALALRNLEGEIADTDHKQRINLVLQELDRINELMAMLLDKTPKSPEVPVPVNIRSLVDDVIKLFRYQMPSGIDVDIDVPDAICRLPRDTLRQVLLNLLRNSAEAIADRPGRIWIAGGALGESLRLTISDNGPGYPDDLLNYGVRPFLSGKVAGTGLGLAVVQRLVRSAGGELQLSRREHGGARTVVILPCKVKSHANDDDHRR